MRRALILLLLMTGCGPTLRDLNDLLTEAGACSDGDTCVVAGRTQCSCGAPVNQSREEEMNSFAASVNCGALSVSCRQEINPRCEEGRCTAD